MPYKSIPFWTSEIPMDKLSDKTINALDAFWASKNHCSVDEIQANGIQTVKVPANGNNEYVQLFRRNKTLVISCSESLFDSVRSIILEKDAEIIFNPVFLGSALSCRVERIIGPAYIGYLEEVLCKSADPNIRILDSQDIGVFEEFHMSVTAQDWRSCGLRFDQPIAACFCNGTIVSAAGYEIWDGMIAHIGIVTRPDSRGAGKGCKCVGEIARHALAQRLIPQYRTLYENSGSMSLARKAGFIEYASTIYIVATAKPG